MSKALIDKDNKMHVMDVCTFMDWFCKSDGATIVELEFAERFKGKLLEYSDK